MATNDWEYPIDTDTYALYSGESTEGRPGSPIPQKEGDPIIDPFFFPMSTIENSTMDKDERNTGPTTDFWTDYPITIDVNGYIFYHDENTGINVRGPAGFTNIKWEDLTEEQRNSLKGRDGINGVNGRDGIDGEQGPRGYSAYEVWLQDYGYDPEDHPISEFYDFIANHSLHLLEEGSGQGSLILNYRGQRNFAYGTGSLATGENTQAISKNSFTAGNNTVTNRENQFSIGQYNQGISTNIFEVGIGSSINDRRNGFSVDLNGNILSYGNVMDSGGNILSDKVNKIAGKGLSTNDFTNTYKNWIDDFTIDQDVYQGSDNPVSNNAVYQAIQEAVVATDKSRQERTTEDIDYCFFHPYTVQDGYLVKANYTTNMTWNPSKLNLNIGNNYISHNNVTAIGSNLMSSSDSQILLGKYNSSLSNDIFEIGYGNSNENRLNFFRVTKNGDAYTPIGTFIDSNGNRLSDKQNKLFFEETIVEDSTNPVTSGGIFSYLVDHGIDPEEGLVIPELDIIETNIGNMQTQISNIMNILNQIGNPREIADDDYPSRIYTYGIKSGEFYIKRIDENEEEEEEENNGGND